MNVTSKELAEAAGVAEGTLFKAFGTKEDLLQALASKHAAMPDAVGEWLRTIDPTQITLPELVRGMIGHAIEQYRLSFRLFYALGPIMEKPDDEAMERFVEELKPWVDALESHAGELRIQPEPAAGMLRMHSAAAADNGISWGVGLSAEEHADIFLYGAAKSGVINS